MNDDGKRISHVVACCASIPTQHATDLQQSGPQIEPTPQSGLKALARRVLCRNNANYPRTSSVEPAHDPENLLLVDRVSDAKRRFFKIAAHEGLADELVARLSERDVLGCAELSDHALAAALRAIRDSALREGGQRPEDETAYGICRHCGPVWLAPEVAACAPIVDGFPRVLGCPWCHVRGRGLAYPQPTHI